MPITIPRKDLFGQRFGRLVVVRRSHSNAARKKWWLCACECGVLKNIRQDDLTGGRSTSCGCKTPELKAQLAATLTIHGHARKGKHTRTYTIWRGMRERCTYPKHQAWKYYGGRGIKVCERLKEFANFLADMGEVPAGLTLERTERDGHYEPGNCRWATQREQCNNTGSNVFLEIGGERRTVAEWARQSGIAYGTIQSRIRNCGWTVERALSEPVR